MFRTRDGSMRREDVRSGARPLARSRAWWATQAGLLACLVLGIGRDARALTLDDPTHFTVKRTFALPSGVTIPAGGLRFSTDGATLYVVSGSQTDTSELRGK